jgi:hypothetical protein
MATEWGRALNQEQRLCLLADYTGEEPDADQAALVVERAVIFVDAMRGIPPVTHDRHFSQSVSSPLV